MNLRKWVQKELDHSCQQMEFFLMLNPYLKRMNLILGFNLIFEYRKNENLYSFTLLDGGWGRDSLYKLN